MTCMGSTEVLTRIQRIQQCKLIQFNFVWLSLVYCS